MRCDDEIARRGVDGNDSWALTKSGQKIVFLRPRPEEIHLDDIIHHLSHICRFTGATDYPYTVGQHSVLVGRLVKRMLDDEGVDWSVDYWDQILAALLHDSEEFILNDLSSPLKACQQGRYQEIAIKLRQVIFSKFDIDWGYHNQIIKDADNTAILIERFYLMPDHSEWPKIPRSEMVYDRPKIMTAYEVRYIFGACVRHALSERDAFRDED